MNTTQTTEPKNVDRFNYWFNQSGHWIYPTRDKALAMWLARGIEGLPPPKR